MHELPLLINIAVAAMLGIGILFGAGNGPALASVPNDVVAKVSLSRQTINGNEIETKMRLIRNQADT